MRFLGLAFHPFRPHDEGLRRRDKQRRRHERYSTGFAVEVVVGGLKVRQTAVNVSRGGLLLTPGFPAQPGERITLSMPGIAGDTRAQVVNQRPDGTGIHFSSAEVGERLLARLFPTTR